MCLKNSTETIAKEVERGGTGGAASEGLGRGEPLGRVCGPPGRPGLLCE